MDIQPITRKELYYNNIIMVLKGEEPEPMGIAQTYDERWLQNIIDAIGGEADMLTTYTRLHLFYANIIKAIAGEEQTDIEPLTREELYLKAIANKFGGEETELPSAVTREEVFLAEIYDLAEGSIGVEKTVTGKTIYITDALAEPMKLADVEIVFIQSGSGTPSPTNIRPISGYTEANMYQYGGKNLFDKNAKNTSNGYASGAYVSASGGSNGSANWNTSEYIPIKGGEAYTLSGLTTASNPAYCFYDKSKTFISGKAYSSQTTKKFTAPSNACYIRISIPKTNVDVVQLEIGSSATTYEAFTSGTVYPINWQTEAGTVYSGHVDLISGVLTVNSIMWTRNSADMDNAGSYPGWKNSGLKALGIIGNAEKKGTLNVGEYYAYNTTGSNDVLFFNTNRYGGMNQTAWKALAIDVQIVIPLPTPQTYHLTPQEISTLAGTNVIWSDANGNTTVTYMVKE